jgi:predicted Kef-type K+ transport protein
MVPVESAAIELSISAVKPVYEVALRYGVTVDTPDAWPTSMMIKPTRRVRPAIDRRARTMGIGELLRLSSRTLTLPT